MTAADSPADLVIASDRIVDIRPVTMHGAGHVLAAIGREVAARGSAGAYLNGWDPPLQPGLPEPTPGWLDATAPDGPLVILHNSGHKAFFNSHAARLAGLTRDTPESKGARYGRDADGELDGTAEFADDVIGSLEVGKYADLVVLSADPRAAPPEKIADLAVRATFLAGRQVYCR